jgi:cytochrome P450
LPNAFERMPGPEDPIAIMGVGSEERLLDAMVRHGATYRFFEPSARRWMVATGDPAATEHVLVTNARNYEKGFFIGLVEMLLGSGIMVSEGPSWLRQRRKVQKALRRPRIDRLVGVLASQSAVLRDRWLAEAGRTVNVTRETSELALGGALAFLFGGEFVDESGAIRPGPFDLLRDVAARDMDFRKAFAGLDPVIRALVERRLAEPGEDALSELVLLDRQDGAAVDVDQLVVETKTLVVAAHETTASCMNWLWLLLARSPAVQRRIHEHAAARPPPSVDSEAMVAGSGPVRHAIREALRLYPPGWVLSRRALADDEIAGHSLPRRTEVLVSPYLLGRNPALWTEPGEFRPERFAGRPPSTPDIPFSAGPRSCVGESMAEAELVAHLLVLSRAIRMSDPEPGRRVAVEARINLRSRDDIRLIPEPW